MGWCQDMDTIINTALLLKNYEDMMFVLVGDGVEKINLMKRAKKLKLNNIKFLPMQPRDKYPYILSASDICLINLKKQLVTPVVPSKLFGIMASGRPVVASLPLEGDAPKIIESAQCGYCVEPENPEKLAKAILKFYDNPSLCEKFGVNGRDYVEKHFSRTICIKKYEKLFLEACGGV